MRKNIIDLLAMDEFYGVSERVDFAKGSRKIPYTWKQAGKLIKRMWNGR